MSAERPIHLREELEATSTGRRPTEIIFDDAPPYPEGKPLPVSMMSTRQRRALKRAAEGAKRRAMKRAFKGL